MQIEGGGGGIKTIWELHTLAVIKLVQHATKECRKLNNPGGIMVVMETSFASSTAVFTRCWQLGIHMLRQSREQNLLAASYKSM